MKIYYISCLALLQLLIFIPQSQANDKGYFRSPDAHQRDLVFTAQGDLWLSQIGADAPAKRLTTHANLETGAKFSPSGDLIAFVASYTNLPAVHVMPTDGGVAKQVSFEYGRTRLHGWLDESTILISANADIGMHSSWILKTINLDTLQTSTYPLSDAIEGALSNDQDTLFFVQHGLQISSDNANHYKGGAAGELWRFDLASSSSSVEAILLTKEHEGSVHTPMVYEDQRVYFVSNQNDIDNIWSMAFDGSDIRQHTKFSNWAVRGASIDGDKIVFQHGADINVYDITNSSVRKVEISLQSDFVDLRTRYITKPLNYFDGANLANTGDKAVVTARGNIAVINTKNARLVKVASDASARARNAILSSDGKTVYAISDQSGDYEIWAFDAFGKQSAKQLTDNGKVLKAGLWISPDGKVLAYSEKNGGLFLLNLENEKVTQVARQVVDNVSDIRFSLDSRYFAASFRPKSETRSRIFLYEIDSQASAVVTSSKYDSYAPAFSHDLNWLYFLSDRTFSPSPSSPWGDRNMGSHFDNRTKVYAISLTRDAEFPFAPSTELTRLVTDEDNVADEDDSSEESDEALVEVEFDSIQKRQWQLDLGASNYTNLLANEKGLFLLDDSTLSSLAFEADAELSQMTDSVTSVSMSSKGKHLLVIKGARNKTQLLSIPAETSFPSKLDDHTLVTKNWTLEINPQEEWLQIFKDTWLMHRDSLFDANMRGLDWTATKEKYMPLLSRITERSELNDIFKQMMGELNALHSQVRGGDLKDDPDSPRQAILGASYSDTKKGVKIDTIFKHDPDILEQTPPLAHPSVNALEGDIITAINNQTIDSIAQLKKALLNTQGQQVLLSLERGKEKIDTIVEPVSVFRINRFRHQHWASQNLQKVSDKNRDIGYLHLYAMGGNDMASFARDFYAQNLKKGLIIDVRRNRGGNIDSILLEKLMRRVWSFWETPQGESWTNMQNAFRGHLVVLADQFTYSDGETFTAGIKALDLGTVIGKQTAGAGVWLTGQNRVVDGGIARVAEFPVFSLEGQWITEGRGISPNIEVDNLPHATFKGKDAQLDAAISYLEEKLQSEPVPKLKALPFPEVHESAGDIRN